jgi:hypothetical protein
MIVRISGIGQYELDDAGVHKLDELDTRLTQAVHDNDEEGFHQALHETIQFIQSSGQEVPHDTVVPSDVIVPPDDSTLEDARRYFTDEGLMAPLPA